MGFLVLDFSTALFAKCSRAADPEFDSHLAPWGFFRVEPYR